MPPQPSTENSSTIDQPDSASALGLFKRFSSQPQSASTPSKRISRDNVCIVVVKFSWEALVKDESQNADAAGEGDDKGGPKKKKKKRGLRAFLESLGGDPDMQANDALGATMLNVPSAPSENAPVPDPSSIPPPITNSSIEASNPLSAPLQEPANIEPVPQPETTVADLDQFGQEVAKKKKKKKKKKKQLEITQNEDLEGNIETVHPDL